LPAILYFPFSFVKVAWGSILLQKLVKDLTIPIQLFMERNPL